MLFDKTQIGGIDATCRIIRSATFEGMADIKTMKPWPTAEAASSLQV